MKNYFKLYTLIIFLFSLNFSLNAQEKYKRYFVLDFKQSSNTESDLFRIYLVNNDDISFKDYSDSTIVRQGKVWGSKNLDEIDKFIFYAKSLARELYYHESFENMEIELITFNKFGKKDKRIFIRNKEYRVGEAWSETGEPLLKNGTGIQSILYKENHNIISEYRDSVLINSYIIRKDKNDTIYVLFDKIAEPKQGLKKFYENIQKNLKLPEKYHGNTYAAKFQFIVNEKGELEEIESLRKEYDEVDKYILKYLQSLPKWNPAIFQGKHVKTQFILPIKFISL